MSDALGHVRYSCGIAGEEVANYVDQLQAKVAELEAEVERLKVDRAKKQKESVTIFDVNCELRQQLAAEQLNNKLLRDALQAYIDEHEECQDADDWMAMMCSMEAHHTADEALYQPSDTFALDSFVAEKVKAIEAERDYHMSNAKHVYEQCSKITKQRDLAVEVLKTAYEVATNHDDRLPFDWAVYCEMLWQAIKESEGSDYA